MTRNEMLNAHSLVVLDRWPGPDTEVHGIPVKEGSIIADCGRLTEEELPNARDVTDADLPGTTLAKGRPHTRGPAPHGRYEALQRTPLAGSIYHARAYRHTDGRKNLRTQIEGKLPANDRAPIQTSPRGEPALEYTEHRTSDPAAYVERARELAAGEEPEAVGRFRRLRELEDGDVVAGDPEIVGGFA